MPVKKILIIDDEENFCRALKKALEMRSTFPVLTATRGDEGIRLAKIHKPDVILLDIMMPGMAGTHVAEELSEDPATRSIPIIFVTAIVKEEELKESGGIIGGRSFIAKPIMIDELIKKINAI
jgi:DNA-binding response OmpR family regulator